MTFDIVALCVQQPDPTTTITATFLPVPLLVHELDTVGLAGSAAPIPSSSRTPLGSLGGAAAGTTGEEPERPRHRPRARRQRE